MRSDLSSEFLPVVLSPFVLLPKLHEHVCVAFVHHRASQLVNEPVETRIARAKPCVTLQRKEEP